jgi:hypothetical protein
VSQCPIDAQKWLEHFDHLDPAFENNPLPVLRELQDRCPVARSDRYDGFWVVTRYEDVDSVIHDPEHFSSRIVMIPRDLLVGFDGDAFSAPPLTADPPFHSKFRRALLPGFAPGQIKAWEPITQDIARRLLEGLAGQEAFDAAVEYAQNIPIGVMARIMGVDESHRDTFTRWVHDLFDAGPGRIDNAAMAMIEMYQYLYEKIEERRARPTEDLITFLMQNEVDGELPDDNDLLGSLVILLLAGIDTTWSALGASLHHLAAHSEDRHRLIAAMDDPESDLWSTAIEEFLRMSSPVAIARIVARDVEVSGQQLKEGDLVFVSYLGANHDPRVFERPEEVIIDRKDNRHVAFGLGIHRCLGSSLARMEMRVALQAFLRQFPDFEVPEGAVVNYTGGQVRGPRTLPIVIRSSRPAPLAR